MPASMETEAIRSPVVVVVANPWSGSDPTMAVGHHRDHYTKGDWLTCVHFVLKAATRRGDQLPAVIFAEHEWFSRVEEVVTGFLQHDAWQMERRPRRGSTESASGSPVVYRGPAATGDLFRRQGHHSPPNVVVLLPWEEARFGESTDVLRSAGVACPSEWTSPLEVRANYRGVDILPLERSWVELDDAQWRQFEDDGTLATVPSCTGGEPASSIREFFAGIGRDCLSPLMSPADAAIGEAFKGAAPVPARSLRRVTFADFTGAVAAPLVALAASTKQMLDPVEMTAFLELLWSRARSYATTTDNLWPQYRGVEILFRGDHWPQRVAGRGKLVVAITKLPGQEDKWDQRLLGPDVAKHVPLSAVTWRQESAVDIVRTGPAKVCLQRIPPTLSALTPESAQRYIDWLERVEALELHGARITRVGVTLSGITEEGKWVKQFEALARDDRVWALVVRSRATNGYCNEVLELQAKSNSEERLLANVVILEPRAGAEVGFLRLWVETRLHVAFTTGGSATASDCMYAAHAAARRGGSFLPYICGGQGGDTLANLTFVYDQLLGERRDVWRTFLANLSPNDIVNPVAVDFVQSELGYAKERWKSGAGARIVQECLGNLEEDDGPGLERGADLLVEWHLKLARMYDPPDRSRLQWRYG